MKEFISFFKKILFSEVTLIFLTSFCILLTLNIVDKKTFEEISNFIRNGDIDIEKTEDSYVPSSIIFTTKNINEGEMGIFENLIKGKENMDYLHNYFRNYLNSTSFGENVFLERSDEGIYITFENSLLFDSGDSKIKNSAKGILSDIANLLKEVDNDILVEGHTDVIPINSDTFESNWALSSSRAISVIHFLEGKGIPKERFTAIGYADTKPITDNTTEEKRKQNRRVVIFIKQNY